MSMIGRQVGSYRLVSLLGQGGMGSVYRAEHVLMGDTWAVKLLAEELAHRPELVARFVDEARAAAKVRHRNLIRVYNVDRTADGVCYLVMEYLEGSSLSRFSGASGPLPAGTVVRLIAQIASALRAIHEHGIVHRDVKPDNVMLIDRNGDAQFPMLLDLGVAHLGTHSTGPGTQTGAVIGTPSYMAPEQLLGEGVGPSADLFSLGVMAYEMATGGWYPWQRDGETRSDYFNLTPTAIYRRQQSEAPVDPRRRVVTMGDAFARALLAPLDLDANRRPKDERAYVVALGGAVPGDEVTPDGITIIDEHARDLLSADHQLETIRAVAPVILASPGSDARYVLGEKLGAGGMAEVFAAQVVGVAGFERPVAIKRVLPELAAQPAFASMFIAEARIASRLSHPNIVSVSDFRQDDQGRLFLVMEYVDGCDLAALVEAGPLSIPVIIYIVAEMLRGLGYAHGRVDSVTGGQGLVHRDVSPHNVLISREGEVKVGDFGLSRATDSGGRALTGTVRGKAAYMAPEQARGEALDRRTDLFAAGIVAWELLSRAPLFTGNMSETMASVLFKDITLPSVLLTGVPPDVEAVVMKLLRREASERYQTAEAAIGDLLRCRDARLDSRDELVRVLRARFPRPGEMPRRTAALATVASPARAEQVTSTAVPTTLGSAASQSVPHVVPAAASIAPMRSRGAALWLTVVAVFGAALAAFAIVFVVSQRHRAARGPDAPVVAASAGHDEDARVAAVADSVGAATAPPVDAALPFASVDAAPMPSPIDAAPPDAGASVAGTIVPLPGRPTQRPVQAVPKGLGELVIIAYPWADVWINGKRIQSTPFRQTMVAGAQRIRLVNNDIGKDEALTVKIQPNKTTTIERDWR